MNNEPLYNSRIINIFMEYINKQYPNVDIASILDYAGIAVYEIDDEGHWFNQNQVDRFHDCLVEKVGNPNIAREVGRYASLSKAGLTIQQYALGFITPASAYKLMGKIYPFVSRACSVQTKKVSDNKIEISVKPKQGVNEKLYQCENRIGTFESVTKLFTDNYAKIEHPICIHKGGDRCLYNVSWETPSSFIWKRVRNYIAFLNFILCITLFFSLPGIYWGTTPILISSLVIILLSFYPDKLEQKEIEIELKNKGDVAGDLLERIDTIYNNALLIHEIGKATSDILEIDKLLQYSMEVIEKRLEFDRGLLMLANDDRTLLMYKAGFGYKNQEGFLENLRFHLDKPKSKGQFVLSFKQQKSFMVNDFKEMEGVVSEKSLELAKAMGVKSFICVPIIYEGVSEGILAVDNIRSKRALSQSDLNLLQGIAPAIAISINNARSYEKIKEREERFRSLGENTPDIIYTLDADGIITYVNPALEKRLKYRINEVEGRHFISFAKDDEIDKLTKVFKRASEKKETIKDISSTFIDKDGSEHLFNISGAPNFDSNGRMTGVVGILKDVSDLKKNYDILQMTLQSTIDAMSNIVESRDPYTAGHQKRVSEIACAIAEEMNLSMEALDGIRMASMIHDIGKMYIPAEILSKPGELNELEITMMRTHPEVGYNILKNIEFTYPVAEIVYQHHERMNGSGYPNGLSGDEIHLEARIIAVADVVEAMSSHRPYRPAIGIEKALDEISESRGVLYDPDVVDVCLKLFKEEKVKIVASA
jgi:PAS domain S-box-containing protein/putative nucleotidyltransferase with HDIG domain